MKRWRHSTYLAGKRILITGANAGIGRATALRLAKRGASICLACRTEEKGEKTAAFIRHCSGNQQVSAIVCDLASFSSIRQAAEQIKERWDRLDVLINNAGVFNGGFKLTQDGFEEQFGVNHLGHFLLTHLLLDNLMQAANPRLINVTSVAHYKGAIDFESFREEQKDKPYHPLHAYAQSKLCNVLFTLEFARRFPKIQANCLHPGLVRTHFGNKHAPWKIRLLWWILKPLMRSAGSGASTSVYLATSPEVKQVTGRYFDDHQCPRKPAPAALDLGLANQLWDYSMQVCQLPNDL